MKDKIDILDRQPFVDRLIEIVRLIADSGRSCTFTIDGRWGCGKSYVLNMFEKQLSVFQDPCAAGDRYLVFHYNCWQYDFYEEPAIAIISAIKSEVEKHNSILPELPSEIQASLNIAKNIGKELLGNFLQTKIGCNPIDIIEKIRESAEDINEKKTIDNEFDKYFQFKAVLDSTKEELKQLAKDKPVILVVDELDRCLPEYTIKVLERLHHLFDEDSNIIVILATDRAQLSRTVRQIFCPNNTDTDSYLVKEYLKKFINFSLSLDNGTISKNFWERYAHILKYYDIGDEASDNLFSEIPTKLFAGIDPRTQERIIERMLTLHQLSFPEHCGAEVLYFELLHQILQYRFKAQGFSWLTRINKERNITAENELGKSLYGYLKNLEDCICTRTVRIAGDGQASSIINDAPMPVAFWLIASLVRVSLEGGKCDHYILNEYAKYRHLLECVQRFDKLSNLIK